jgi:hypothetical protein
MKTHFTAEQFFEVLKNYNVAAFPMQFILYMLSVIAIYLVIKPIPQSDKIINSILAFFWFWMGIVFHLTYFTTINKAAYLFGGLFILQGLLFLYLGVFQDKIRYQFHHDKYGVTGISLALFSLIGYPLAGYFLGHTYPASPTFGLPCPTTIFTFGLLLQTDRKIPVLITAIPLLWSIIGFTAAFRFGMIEDTGLLVSGLLTLASIIFHNRMLPMKTVTAHA